METNFSVKSYEDLNVWKKSYGFILDIYKLTQKFPQSEIYGLTSQIRRSSVSVAANIAEGRGRQHTPEFIHFLHLSKGSLEETKVYLNLSKDLNYITESEFINLEKTFMEIGRMLSGLIRSLKNRKKDASS